MILSEIFTVLALVATATAIPDPMITPKPNAPQPRQAKDECDSKYASLRKNAANMLDQPGLLPWFGDEMSKAVLTQTPDFNVCDEFALSERVTPPPSLSAAWTSWRNKHSSWVSAHRSEALSLASVCESKIRSMGGGFNFEQAVVTDKAECESLYSKQLGFVPTMPKITQTFPKFTDTRTGQVIGVFTTVTPGAKTPPTTTGAGASGSGNAGPRETGSLFAAAVAMVGVVAVL